MLELKSGEEIRMTVVNQKPIVEAFSDPLAYYRKVVIAQYSVGFIEAF